MSPTLRPAATRSRTLWQKFSRLAASSHAVLLPRRHDIPVIPLHEMRGFLCSVCQPRGCQEKVLLLERFDAPHDRKVRDNADGLSSLWLKPCPDARHGV